MAATNPHPHATPSTSDLARWSASLTAIAQSFGSHIIRNDVFPARSEHVAQIRRNAGQAAADLSDRDTIAVLTSELATNAVVHSGSEFLALIIAQTATGLCVAIADQGQDGFPSLHQKSTTAASGRGLYLIDSLARRWGILRQSGIGTIVWFYVENQSQQAA